MQVGDKGRPPRGGRGLKYNFATDYHATQRSPPSRGAWIEMLRDGQRGIPLHEVAPLAGGVD